MKKSIAKFRVVSVGPHVSFQDAGRAGKMRFGVPQSGPMDRFSFAAAFAALGIEETQTAIEVSLGGLTLECLSGHVTLAFVGGEFNIQLDGKSCAPCAVLTIERGQTLSIGPGKSGSWCYLAFMGHLETPIWIGSASTHAPSNFGGGLIAQQQVLVVRQCISHSDNIRPIDAFASTEKNDAFRVVIGPQDRHFDQNSLRSLLQEEYTFTAAYDRMGVRLKGPALLPNAALSIPSEPIVRGSIQVSGDGTPTVLLADHQTTGGYPKIATIISADLDRFVQLRAPAKVAFRSITAIEAVAAARQKAEQDAARLNGLRSTAPNKMTRLLRQTGLH